MKKKFQVAIANYPLTSNCNDINVLFDRLINSGGQSMTLYIHIPFCSQICHYCIYHRITTNHVDMINQYVKAVVKEIELYSAYPVIQACKIDAIFFGGGTPTVLSAKNLCDIIDACKKYLPVAKDVEITVETNPFNADKEKLEKLKEKGVNRISSGIQTFADVHREHLGVALNSDQVCQWLNDIQKYKFREVSVDIMYALPGQSIEEALSDITMAQSLGVSHISLYELIIFAQTKLPVVIEENKLKNISINEKFEMYQEIDCLLTKMQYLNQIIPEYYLDNPSTFWRHTFDPEKGCIAIGCSSYGFLGELTYQNISSIQDYITAINNRKLSIHYLSKPMTIEQEMERFIVLTSRTGIIDASNFEKRFHITLENCFGEILKRHIEEGLIRCEGNKYILTMKGKYLQSDLAVDYMQSIFIGKSNNYKKLKISNMRI